MKKIKLLPILCLLVVLFAGNAYAQTTINASAEVQSNLSASEEQAINFGSVVQDFSAGNPSLDPSDGTTANIENATNVTVGMVSVSGTQDQTVDVTVDTDIILAELDGDQITLTPSYNYTYDNLTSGAPSNPVLASNSTTNFTMTLDGTTDDGVNTILIGGTLTESKTGALNLGTYEGTGSITVSYQ